MPHRSSRPVEAATEAHSGRAATPIAFVQAIVAGYRRYGMNPAAALASAGIRTSDLGKPDSHITAAQMERVSEAAMRELDDEALGWFSRRLPWGSYGMLCRASLTAPDLGIALKRWCRHHRLLVADVHLRLEVDEDLASLDIDEGEIDRELREFCLVTLLRYVHGFACWAIDSRIPLAEVRFPFAAPDHAAVYPLIFPGPVAFDASRAGFTFDASYLALSIVRDETAMTQMLERALPLTVLQYRRDRLLVRRARDLLAAHPDEIRDAPTLAHRLNVSTRTLYRQLRDAGSSLQQLKDGARRVRAEELLRRTRRPIAQIARAVGFRNEKSFSRAFRQWTGQSPRDFRDRHRPPA